ncbi:hypothetical protein [Microbacterium xylanilyticum]
MKYLAELLYLAGLLIVIVGVGISLGIAAVLIAAGLALVGTGLLLDHNRKEE